MGAVKYREDITVGLKQLTLESSTGDRQTSTKLQCNGIGLWKTGIRGYENTEKDYFWVEEEAGGAFTVVAHEGQECCILMQEQCRETQGAKALPGNWQRGQESGQRPGDEEPLPVFTMPFGQAIGEPLESDK